MRNHLSQKAVVRRLTQEEIAECIKSIQILGYAVVPRYVEAAEREHSLDLIRHYRAAESQQLRNVSANQQMDKYLYHLQFKDIWFFDLITEGNVLDVMIPFLNDEYYRLIPPHLPNFLLAYYNARSSVAALALHIDNYIPYTGRWPVSMQLAISLNGQSAETGATTIVPGSHVSGNYPDRSFQGAVPLTLNPGDAVIWDSRLWHGALGNPTERERWSLIATFRPWWAKQNFDPVRGFSSALFDKLSPQQKALAGFLSLPAVDENEKVALKEGFDDLLPSIAAYRQRRRCET